MGTGCPPYFVWVDHGLEHVAAVPPSLPVQLQVIGLVVFTQFVSVPLAQCIDANTTLDTGSVGDIVCQPAPHAPFTGAADGAPQLAGATPPPIAHDHIQRQPATVCTCVTAVAVPTAHKLADGMLLLSTPFALPQPSNGTLHDTLLGCAADATPVQVQLKPLALLATVEACPGAHKPTAGEVEIATPLAEPHWLRAMVGAEHFTSATLAGPAPVQLQSKPIVEHF